MRGDLFCHLVTFEDVLTGRDLEAHFVSQADEHQDLVGAIAVSMDEPLAFEHLDERIELKIAPRREQVLSRLFLGLVVLPFLAIGLGAGKRIADDVLDPLSRGWKPLRIGGRLAALPRDVLAEGKLDSGQRALKDQVARPRLAVAELDDDRLATNRVGAAVQNIRGGRATRQVAIDVDICRIEDVLHAGHRADRDAALVDRVVADVGMRIDDPGRDELAGRVVDVSAGRNRDVRANGRDLSVAYQHRPVGDRAASGGDDRCIPNRHDSGRRALSEDGHCRGGATVPKDAGQRTHGEATGQPAANHAKPPENGRPGQRARR